MKRIGILVMVIALFTIVGCGTTKTSQAEKETQLKQDWVLTSMTFDGAEITLPTELHATMNFNDERASGKCCNTFTGEYEFEKDEVSFSKMAMTRRACVPEIAKIESNYFQLLEQKAKITFESKDTLTLTFPSGVLVYTLASSLNMK